MGRGRPKGSKNKPKNICMPYLRINKQNLLFGRVKHSTILNPSSGNIGNYMYVSKVGSGSTLPADGSTYNIFLNFPYYVPLNLILFNLFNNFI